ncbi:MAG: DUF1631 domain-containing protein [Gammaproteobacteria bacterium HGW-Gammaproteobacteria-5]|nr:MAG: DUF1631 domain-containing protein [Gammaproteobacteria bacterium HGW-Gammaproteobacteria-5]
MSQTDPRPHSSPAPAAAGEMTTVLERTRELAIARLTEAVRTVLAVADDALFDFMQKSGGNSNQPHFLDAMRELRRRRGEIEDGFAAQLQDVWQRFVAREPITSEDAMGASSSGDLSLLSEDDMESQIAARMLGQAMQKDCSAVSLQLMQRLSWVGGRQELDADSSPLGAAHIAVALRAGLAPCEMPGDIKLILFKLCERELPKPVTAALEEVNECLLKAGVLPHLRVLPNRVVPRASAPPQAATNDYREPAPAANESARPGEQYAPNERALFATLHELLRGWRQSEHAPAPMPSAAHLRPISSNEMISVLSLLQSEIPDGVRAAIQDPSQSVVQRIKGEVLANSRQLGIDPEKACLSPVDEDAIDLVGMLFDVLLDERQLKGSARELIGRMVVPFIKVALLDRRMFLRKEHPARRLLNSVAEACEGNEGETPAERTLLAKAEEVVQRLSMEFNENVAIFQTLEEEFRCFMDQHRKRVDLAERRASEAQQGKERLEAARAYAQAELDKRLADTALPPALDVVMRRYWTHHLVVLQLREGVDSDATRAALACGDGLLAMAQAAHGGEAALAALLPQLSAGMLPILSSSGCVGEAADTLVDAVADELRGMAAGKVQPIAAVPELFNDGSTDELDERRASAARDASPVRLVSDRSKLEFSPEDVEALQKLPVGSWVEFIDGEGEAQPAKLSWISPISSRLLFVNRRGLRVCVASVEELAVMMHEQRFSIRGTNAAFERAMHQVLGQLRASHERTETSTDVNRASA